MKKRMVSRIGRKSVGARAIAAALFGAGIAALVGCASGGGGAGAVSGGAILTLDDGDTAPSRYAGLDVDTAFRSGPDTLTSLQLPLPRSSDRQIAFAQVDVRNRAVGVGRGLSVSGDGAWALVVTGAESSDLGAEAALVSLAGEDGPSVAERIELEGAGLVSGAFHPFEDRAVVLTADPPALTFLEVGAEGPAALHSLPLTGMLDSAMSPSGIAWHPSGRFLAITLGEADRVCFVQVERGEEGAPMVRKWGNEVATDPAPHGGVFSRDGRFFISSNLAFRDGESVQVFAASGTLTVIRMADSMQDEAVHRRTAMVRLPHQPHAIAMSPNGDQIVTVSRREVDLGLDRSERLHGTVVLTGFDAVSGTATVGAARESSSLPSAVCFDADGSHVLISDFETSEIQVWRVRGDELEYTGTNIGTGYGPHAIAVIP